MAKPLLSSDHILDGALMLLASEGSDALSVRKLAAHLRCSPNTLYRQVGSRDELIRQLLLRQFGNINPLRAGDSWQDTAYRWCLGLRASMLNNPQLTRLMTVQHRELVLQDVNALLKILLQQGLEKALALRLCRVLTHVVLGLCFTELQTPDDYRRRRRGSRSEVAAEDLLIAEQAGRKTDSTVPDVFANAVGWVIAGAEVQAL